MRDQITYTRARSTDDIFLPVKTTPIETPKKNNIGISSLLVVLIVSVSFGVASGAGGATLSYFRDDEHSPLNMFSAGLFGFTVEASGTTHAFDEQNLDTDSLESTILPNANSLPGTYKITLENSNGSALCSALHASAASPFAYDGTLLGFSTTTTLLSALQLAVTLPDTGSLSTDDTCTVDLVYHGWTGEAENTGYRESHIIPLSFTYIAAPVPAAAAVLETESLSEIETDVATDTPQTSPEPQEASSTPSTTIPTQTSTTTED